MTEAVARFKSLLGKQPYNEVTALRELLIGGKEGDHIKELTNYVEGLESVTPYVPLDASYADWKRVLVNDYHLSGSSFNQFWELVANLFRASGIPAENTVIEIRHQLEKLIPEGEFVPVYYFLLSRFPYVSQTDIGTLIATIEEFLPPIDQEALEAWNTYPKEYLMSKAPGYEESDEGLYDLPIEDKERALEHQEVAHVKLPPQTREFIWLNEPEDPIAQNKLLPKNMKIDHRHIRDELTHHYTLMCINEESLRTEVKEKFKEEFQQGNTLFKANIIFMHTLETPISDDAFSYELIKAHPQFQHRTPTYIRQEQYNRL